jgi:P pilus assembly chaperone PapD
MRFLTLFYFAGSLLLTAWPAAAIYLNTTVYSVEARDAFLSIPVVNNTSMANIYSVHAFKIDKPGVGGETRLREKEKDVIWSPLNITILPGGKDYFKIFYRGPKDSQERYFRIIFREVPVTIVPFKNNARATEVVSTISMSALLIVRPRNTVLKYSYDEKLGVLKNIGNTFFRVIIHKGCAGDDESSHQFYMLPDEHYASASLKGMNRKFIVAEGKYIPLGTACFGN